VNQLRTKLILIFSAATLVPLAAILWVSTSLLEISLRFVSTAQTDTLSKSLESVAREYYREVRDQLKQDAENRRIDPVRMSIGARKTWPAYAEQFWESTDKERFAAAEPEGNRLVYMIRDADGVRIYSKTIGVDMEKVREQFSQARDSVSRMEHLDLHRGVLIPAVLSSIAIWIVALAAVVYFSNRISRPIQNLTSGLSQLAAGNFETQVHDGQKDEVGRAIQAFNKTAVDLRESRERLVYLTQIASWQLLARKMAHELKNSLTPIRLTVEEIVARQGSSDGKFLQQAAQVVVDEVESLERRVRAFSEFATEPASTPAVVDINSMLQERIQFLSVGHQEIAYDAETDDSIPKAWADPDQIKGILTNLLENAAEAAGNGGKVLGITRVLRDKVIVEIHDSGPGLSVEARASLFEPSISFKRHGMGLGLSISRKNALMSGGDLESIQGKLGGAGFQLTIPAAAPES
jgi:two-component system, NtrC family, nitrogen regulation sensor histidine kinase NtrY